MRRSQEETVEHLTRSGAVIQDSHIVYASGRHGSAYVNKDVVFQYPGATASICRLMADVIAERYDGSSSVEVILGPVVGGAILAQCVGQAYINRGFMVRVGFADKLTDDTFVLKRGYDNLVAGKNVWVVEDILTTGGSVRKVVEVVQAAGGKVVGASAIVNRGNVTPEQVGVPHLYALADIKMDSWPADECPLCREQVPINTSVGKGRAFLAAQAMRS